MFTFVQTRGGTANVEVIQSSLENLESDSNAARVRGGRAPEKVVRGDRYGRVANLPLMKMLSRTISGDPLGS